MRQTICVVFGLSGPSFACGEQTRGMIQERTAGIQNGASPTADVATAVPPRVSFFGSRLNAVDSVLGVNQRCFARRRRNAAVVTKVQKQRTKDARCHREWFYSVFALPIAIC